MVMFLDAIIMFRAILNILMIQSFGIFLSIVEIKVHLFVIVLALLRVVHLFQNINSIVREKLSKIYQQLSKIEMRSNFSNYQLPIIFHQLKQTFKNYLIIYKALMIKLYSLHFLILLQLLIFCTFSDVSLPVFASSCNTQSVAPRICPQSTNATEYLLYIKKGGTDILSTNDYDPNFFLCEQYNYDCGYVQTQAGHLQISDGIQLVMSNATIDSILPANSTLAAKLKPYLNLNASSAKCGMSVFPLVLTSEQSQLFFNNYMANFTTQIKTAYSTQKCSVCSDWSNLNINIKTAVLQILKENKDMQSPSSTFWSYFVNNQFIQMSQYLKTQYQNKKEVYLLHAGYLIDSVTSSCNKEQSINFLVDQSGSITADPFKLALQFLQMYVNQTNDDPALMSFNFYSSSYQNYLQYGNNKSTILSMLQSKTYPGGGTNTGLAINATISNINSGNFSNGLPKIMVVLTDGGSSDDVLMASNYARDNGITLIAVGIGLNVNTTQLLQIAQTSSNMILISSYSQLSNLVNYISNYFCKQIVTIDLNQTIINNIARVPESPNYFRVIKSPTDYYQLQINYQSDPILADQIIYESQIDPFPNSYTQYTNFVSYRPTITKKIIFIQPTSEQNILVKKNLYKPANISASYVSVGATNMKFNVSLTKCKSSSCSSQRASLASFGQKSQSNQTTSKNYLIYFFILGSLIVLACLSIIGMYFIRKLSGEEQTQYQINSDLNDQIQPQLTEQDLNENQQHLENKSNKSNKSHKSNKSNKSKKSNKSQKRNKSNEKNEIHSDKKSQNSPEINNIQPNITTTATARS